MDSMHVRGDQNDPQEAVQSRGYADVRVFDERDHGSDQLRNQHRQRRRAECCQHAHLK